MNYDLFSLEISVLLIDTAIKSLLLLTGTWVVALTIRRRSAAAVHRLWTLAFCGCLVIPMISLFLPTWSLPILPELWSADSNPPVAMTVVTTDDGKSIEWPNQFTGTHSGAPFEMPPSEHALVLPAANEPPLAPAPQHDSADTRPTVATIDAIAIQAGAAQYSWIAACFALWIGGVVFFLLRTVWHQLILVRLLRRSTLITDEAWTRAAADASESLGLKRRVQLRSLNDARSPMIAGILRSIVLLPPDSSDWSLARRRLVLLHELAHAKRHDVLSQTIAGLVCTLHWFNPICWIGLLQMRKLRELACDDLVLACGQQPTEYADVLLNVARSYRHQSLTTAVGMARSSNVENRILAILDMARSHVSLSRKAARTLLVLATVTVAIIGTMRLQTQADQPASASEASTEVVETPDTAAVESKTVAKKTDDDLRTMEIRVRDEKGRPIEGAKLHVGLWELVDSVEERKFKANRDFVTDALGITQVDVPRSLWILRLWIRKEAFVPEFVNFAQGTHAEGKRIPDRFDFELARGTQLSGKVVDESGQPISGVEVDIKVAGIGPSRWENPKSMISVVNAELTEEPVVTDDKGKWTFANAPPRLEGNDYTFGLKFTHKDYVSDSSWGELQGKHKITTPMLRDGNAQIVLNGGDPIVGRLIDSSGTPVTKGLVIWHDSSDVSSKIHRSRVDKTGHFKTHRLLRGEFPVTVIAPGFMPIRRIVNASETLEPLSFTMRPGKQLRLKVTNLNGMPIPSAFVSMREWRDVGSVSTPDYYKMSDSLVPRRADGNGVYQWDWAPDDAVTYRVSAQGYKSKVVTLTANDAEHVVKLPKSLTVYGLVTDAVTGEPVEEFHVIPVTVFQPKFLHTEYRDQVVGSDGFYKIEVDDGAEIDYRFQIRIEAQGYRSALSEKSFGYGDGRVMQEFSLEPASVREGHVVDENGDPVAGALVYEGTPSIVPTMKNAKMDVNHPRSKTYSDGQFQLAATFESTRIRVTHESGYAEIVRQPDETIGTIRLQPWASLSGTLVHDGKPIADEWIYFYSIAQHGLGEPRFQDSYTARTDAEGRFEFKRLPPIASHVRANVSPWRDSRMTSGQSAALDLKPGERTTVSLGSGGMGLNGRVIATGRDNSKLNKSWSLNYLIRREQGIPWSHDLPKLSFDPTGPVQASWFLDPKHDSWLRSRQHYFVKLAADGQLHVSGVPAGVYDLVLRLYEQPAGCLVETIGEKVVTVNVSADDAKNAIKDIGTIEVQCRSGPRVGENMWAYQFTDTNGQQRNVRDMQGRYVLMHAWASWCKPCLKSMPDVKLAEQAYSSQRITFVGLNIDKDDSQAKTLAGQGGWQWSQNYLGDDSDMAKQLAISSVPNYYLIGPDGLLAATSTDWEEMKKQIDATLKK